MFVYSGTDQQALVSQDSDPEYRYLYYGYEFEFSEEDFSKTAHELVEITRVLLYLRFSSSLVDAPLIMDLQVRLRATSATGRQYDKVMDTRVQRTQVLDNVGCDALDVTSWLQYVTVTKREALPLRVSVEMMKICGHSDESCKIVVPDAPFAVITVHSYDDDCILV